MFENKRILICPLNWGIGHATRMVAYARQLEKNGNTIIVAGDNDVLDVFEEELPHIERIFFKDINVRYSSGDKTVRKLVFRSPLFLCSIFRHHFKLQRLLSEIDVDVVISDNRPSLWSKKVKSYYVSHQPNLKLSDGWHWVEPIATAAHQWFIRHFEALLIPDVEGEKSFSGELSQVKDSRIKTHYIGWLSRFDSDNLDVAKEDYTLLILSGVEPSRSLLRDQIIKRYAELDEQLIVAGDYKAKQVGKTTILPYVRTEALKPMILAAKHVICRSGFSMMTDLKVLGIEAELIPTPGQPEQEYLAKLHSKSLK